MKKSWIAGLVVLGAFGVWAETVTNGLDLQGGLISGHGYVPAGDNGLAFTNYGLRDLTLSAGQLSGVDPETGVIITNSANLLSLKAESLTAVSNVTAGGSFVGDGSQLTNLNVNAFSGTLNASSLPTSGTWDASGMAISNATLQDVIAELSTMTNLTVGGEALATVISNLQQQVAQVYVSQNSVTVQSGGSEVTNGFNLIAAYADAKNMNPSATNRIAVIVPPGRYDLGTAGLQMDTPYIDLIGLTTDRSAQYLYGAPGEDNGVIRQSADDVRIENLTLYTLSAAGAGGTDPAAYYPTVPGSNTVVRNCEFAPSDYSGSMRIGAEFAGSYENCTVGLWGFGGFEGTASGTFINCQGGIGSFGGFGGTVSGTFINCQGGSESFGGECGTVSGTFIDCQAEEESFGGSYGTTSGTFIDCQAGYSSFGGAGGTLQTTAVLVNCTAGTGSFGSFNTAATNFNYNASGYTFAGGPVNGSFAGDGSGLTNLNISASSLPTSGTWDASGTAISNATLQDVIAELSTMTNLTVGGEALATVISNLQQQVAQVYVSQNSVTVEVGGSDVTNGLNLITAYAIAKTMYPSATNRIAVIVPPGRYDLGTAGLQMDTPYIDLIGLTTDRSAQYLYGAPGEGNGVVRQSADNVRIENLMLYNQSSDGSGWTAPAAYYPTVSGYNTVVRNCEFAPRDNGGAMRCGGEYAGRYENCTAGDWSFGGDESPVSGTFIGCQAGENSFGSYGEVSGTFIDCQAGWSSFGADGVLSTTAVIVNCTAGPGSFGPFNMAATNFNYNASGHTFAGGPISGDGSGLTNLNLSAYIGDNLMWTNGALSAQPGYADSNAVAAVSTQWTNLDTDATDDFNGSFTNLTEIPADLADGDDDTHLSEAEVVSMVTSNGFVTTNDLAALTAAAVGAYTTNQTDQAISDAISGIQIEGYVATNHVGDVSIDGALSMTSNRVVNVAAPVEDGDAVSLASLKGLMQALPKQGDLEMGTFTNGVQPAVQF